MRSVQYREQLSQQPLVATSLLPVAANRAAISWRRHQLPASLQARPFVCRSDFPHCANGPSLQCAVLPLSRAAAWLSELATLAASWLLISFRQFAARLPQPWTLQGFRRVSSAAKFVLPSSRRRAPPCSDASRSSSALRCVAPLPLAFEVLLHDVALQLVL